MKPTRTCSVDGCERTDGLSRGWCSMHYRRWKRTGDTGVPGWSIRERGLSCVIDGCERPNHGGGYCSTHLTRVKARGNPGSVTGVQYVKRDSHPGWVPDYAVSYATMHMRIRDQRGPAKNYPCTDCGSPAHEWAYNNDDPRERIGTTSAGHSVAFSTSADHYSPRCARCHRQFDAKRRASK